MAKGFAAGLIQGAVVCGAGLVALSLALPQPPRPDQVAALSETAPESAAAPVPVETVAPQAPAPEATAETPPETPSEATLAAAPGMTIRPERAGRCLRQEIGPVPQGRQRLPDARREVIAGAAHMLPVTHAGALAPLFAAHLA